MDSSPPQDVNSLESSAWLVNLFFDTYLLVMAHDHIVVYALGDQTFNATRLTSILLLWDNALVSDLVQRTTQRLQQEVAELEPEQRSESPAFAQLLDLIPYWTAGTLTPALCQALTCFAQVGAFLASHSYEPGSKPFPTASTACLTGICTGLLSAAAVSHSTTAGELLLLGVESIAVAFRLGSLAANVGSRIATCKDAGGTYFSWTAAIAGTNIDAVRKQLDDFDVCTMPKQTTTTAHCFADHCVQECISSSAYLSAQVSANQINISAAPHTLRDFLSSLLVLECSSTRLPVLAPYHAPHLYCERDVEQALRPVTASRGTIHASRAGNAGAERPIPIISSGTGQVISGDTFTDALRSAVTDCLLHVVRYDLLGPAIASHFLSIGAQLGMVIQPVALGGSERLESAVCANLDGACAPRHVESIETFLERQHQQQISQKASQSKIAVLSCAGRFPRASNMDQFWDILLHGVDTHQLVPECRWSLENVSGTKYGCWLEDASAFDAKFFNVSPREAPQMDPAQRIALMCATEAMEEAGIVPGRTPSTQHSRIGVYFGVTSNDWMETKSAQVIDSKQPYLA